MHSNYKIGMRNIKTSISVLLCLLIGFIFKRDAFYSSIAAVMCLQPTLDQTFQTGVNRILGTIIGGIGGFLLLQFPAYFTSYYHWSYMIIVSLMVMLLIYLCNVVRIPGAVAICCVVFLGIATDFDKEIADTFIYVVNRVLDTSIGIALAMLVNKYIYPAGTKPPSEPKPEAASETDKKG